jgi:hypothetical protein
VSAVGLVLLTRIGPGAGYWVDVLPGVIVFGLGLSLLVAPLTTTVLAAADDRHAGVASGVNNAVARAAGLLAVAALPLVIGLTTAVYEDPPAFASAFARAMWLCAVLLVAGGVLSWLAIRNPLPTTPAVAGAAPGGPIGSGPADVDGVRGSAQGSPGALAGGHRPDLAPDGTPPGGVRAASAPADGAHAAPVLADGARAGGPDADLAPAESACRVCDPTVPAVPVRPRP